MNLRPDCRHMNMRPDCRPLILKGRPGLEYRPTLAQARARHAESMHLCTGKTYGKDGEGIHMLQARARVPKPYTLSTANRKVSRYTCDRRM